MMILKSSDAKSITSEVNESKRIREFMKTLVQTEQQKMHNVFNNIKKAAMEGDNFIIVETSYFTEPMLDMVNFLGYKLIKSELRW